MNTGILNVLITIAVVVGQCAAIFDADLLCTLVVPGTKLKDPRACNVWIQCVDGKPVSHTCDDNLFYDRESETCVESTATTCISSQPCAAVPNGFVADPYSCNGYYYCTEGVGAKGTCSVGMNFNPGTQDCIRNFPCQIKMDPDSYCNIFSDGVFIKSTTSCNGYELCWDEVIIDGTCPGTFYFNAAFGRCDYPDNVVCTVTEKPVLAEDGQCAAAGDFITDGNTCNGYYYCKATTDGEMEIIHGDCPSDRFFTNGMCLLRSQVQCVHDRCAGLGETNIELANDSDDGCTGYLICQSGVTIGTGTCPTGTYFDELSQRCVDSAISYPACALSTTTTTSETSSATTTMMNGNTESTTGSTTAPGLA